MARTSTLYDSAVQATKLFRTFEEGDPDLVDIGIPAVREYIGGIGGGNLVGIAAGQNVGKSSLILSMLTNARDQGGVISMEDGADVWGARLLARFSDVGPTKIRRKAFSEADIESIQEALVDMEKRFGTGGPFVDYRVGGSVDDIEEGVKALKERGCRWIVLDYLQKCRGHNPGDRRGEVGVTMNRFHKACADADIVPIIMSQLIRMSPGKEPFPSHMKESGDIENECRLIIMLWRDSSDSAVLRAKVAKSSFGGGGKRFAYRYTDAEYLVDYEEDDDDF